MLLPGPSSPETTQPTSWLGVVRSALEKPVYLSLRGWVCIVIHLPKVIWGEVNY